MTHEYNKKNHVACTACEVYETKAASIISDYGDYYCRYCGCEMHTGRYLTEQNIEHISKFEFRRKTDKAEWQDIT